MSMEFQAIYENGVLRPLTPLNLPESAEVVLRLDEADRAEGTSPAELKRQQVALNVMFAEADRLPQAARNDGLSGRDHDKILYGSGT